MNMELVLVQCPPKLKRILFKLMFKLRPMVS